MSLHCPKCMINQMIQVKGNVSLLSADTGDSLGKIKTILNIENKIGLTEPILVNHLKAVFKGFGLNINFLIDDDDLEFICQCKTPLVTQNDIARFNNPLLKRPVYIPLNLARSGIYSTQSFDGKVKSNKTKVILSLIHSIKRGDFYQIALLKENGNAYYLNLGNNNSSLSAFINSFRNIDKKDTLVFYYPKSYTKSFEDKTEIITPSLNKLLNPDIKESGFLKIAYFNAKKILDYIENNGIYDLGNNILHDRESDSKFDRFRDIRLNELSTEDKNSLIEQI